MRGCGASVPRTCAGRATSHRMDGSQALPRGRPRALFPPFRYHSLAFKMFLRARPTSPGAPARGGLVSEVRAPGAPHPAFVPQEAQVRRRVWPAGRPWPLCPEKQPAGQQDACAHQPQAHTETRGPGPSCPLSPAGRVTGASLPSPGLGFCVRETERQSRPREVAPGMRPPLSDGTFWVDRLIPFGHRQPHVATEHLRRD